MTVAPRTQPSVFADRTVLACMLLAAALRFFHLGAQSLWVDEMLTLTVATPKPDYPIWQLLRHNVHGPLHTFVVYLFRFVSENDAWLRLPSAVAGVASVPLLFLWVRPRLGETAARWAALLLAVNPLHIHYSQELRNYAFALCAVLGGNVLLDRALAAWSWRRGTAFATVVAAALLCNFSTAFAFAAQSLVYVRHNGLSRQSIGRWAFVVAVACLLISPWIYRVDRYVDFSRLATPVMPGELGSEERLRGDTTVRPESVPYTAYAYSVGFSLGPSLRDLHDTASMGTQLKRHAAVVVWVSVLFGGLVVAGALAVVRQRGPGLLLEILAYAVLPLLATLLLNWQNAKAFNVRYVLVGLPAFVALLAAGVALAGNWRSWLAGVLVVATSAASLANYYFKPAYAREDVRGAIAAVEARLTPGECIFAPTVWQIVSHYQRGDAPVHYVYRDPPHLAARQLGDLFAACDSFWYLRARPWVDDPDGSVLAAIQDRYRAAETLAFAGVDVIHFIPKD